jgi:hypothetical protein
VATFHRIDCGGWGYEPEGIARGVFEGSIGDMLATDVVLGSREGGKSLVGMDSSISGDQSRDKLEKPVVQRFARE